MIRDTAEATGRKEMGKPLSLRPSKKARTMLALAREATGVSFNQLIDLAILRDMSGVCRDILKKRGSALDDLDGK